MSRALRLRREHPEWFGAGAAYEPLDTSSRPRGGVRPGRRVVTVVPRLAARRRDGWGDDAVQLPSGRWRDVLTGLTYEGRTHARRPAGHAARRPHDAGGTDRPGGRLAMGAGAGPAGHGGGGQVELGRGSRHLQEEALRLVAPQAPSAMSVCVVLDALGDAGDAQRVSHLDGPAHEGSVGGVDGQPLDQATGPA